MCLINGYFSCEDDLHAMDPSKLQASRGQKAGRRQGEVPLFPVSGTQALDAAASRGCGQGRGSLRAGARSTEELR